MRSFNSNSFNTEDLKKKLSFTKIANINGENINIGTDPDKYMIMSGVRSLVNRGLATYSSDGGENSLVSESMAFLSVLGVTVDSSLGKDIDLKNYATDTEVVENPNIQDKSFKDMKGKQIDGTDKFPDTDDSFYTLDSKPRQYKQAETDRRNKILPEAAIEKMTADLSATNFDPAIETQLKQFQSK